jgi:hypothetical protein
MPAAPPPTIKIWWWAMVRVETRQLKRLFQI